MKLYRQKPKRNKVLCLFIKAPKFSFGAFGYKSMKALWAVSVIFSSSMPKARAIANANLSAWPMPIAVIMFLSCSTGLLLNLKFGFNESCSVVG